MVSILILTGSFTLCPKSCIFLTVVKPLGLLNGISLRHATLFQVQPGYSIDSACPTPCQSYTNLSALTCIKEPNLCKRRRVPRDFASHAVLGPWRAYSPFPVREVTAASALRDILGLQAYSVNGTYFGKYDFLWATGSHEACSSTNQCRPPKSCLLFEGY